MGKKLIVIGIFLLIFLNFVLAVECGDFICEGDEETSCPVDCQTGEIPMESLCGDLICDVGEETSCPIDCSAESGINVCGNFACEEGENELTCPEDCEVGEQNNFITEENISIPENNLPNESDVQINIENESVDTGADVEQEGAETVASSPEQISSESFFSSTTFKIAILIFILILIIVGIIIFFIWKSKYSNVETNQFENSQINSQ